jgi:hypothetical protein
MSAVLSQYHEEQYPICGHDRSCHAGPLSCTHSFTGSPHLLDAGDFKLRPLYYSENPWAFICFQFSIYAAICRNATPAYDKSYVCDCLAEMIHITLQSVVCFCCTLELQLFMSKLILSYMLKGNFSLINVKLGLSVTVIHVKSVFNIKSPMSSSVLNQKLQIFIL